MHLLLTSQSEALCIKRDRSTKMGHVKTCENLFHLIRLSTETQAVLIDSKAQAKNHACISSCPPINYTNVGIQADGTYK